MSGENIINSDIQQAKNSNKNNNKRVDINVLLNRVRADQKKEKFENTIFFALVAGVVIVTGIIISL